MRHVNFIRFICLAALVQVCLPAARAAPETPRGQTRGAETAWSEAEPAFPVLTPARPSSAAQMERTQPGQSNPEQAQPPRALSPNSAYRSERTEEAYRDEQGKEEQKFDQPKPGRLPAAKTLPAPAKAAQPKPRTQTVPSTVPAATPNIGQTGTPVPPQSVKTASPQSSAPVARPAPASPVPATLTAPASPVPATATAPSVPNISSPTPSASANPQPDPVASSETGTSRGGHPATLPPPELSPHPLVPPNQTARTNPTETKAEQGATGSSEFTFKGPLRTDAPVVQDAPAAIPAAQDGEASVPPALAGADAAPVSPAPPRTESAAEAQPSARNSPSSNPSAIFQPDGHAGAEPARAEPGPARPELPAFSNLLSPGTVPAFVNKNEDGQELPPVPPIGQIFTPPVSVPRLPDSTGAQTREAVPLSSPVQRFGADIPNFFSLPGANATNATEPTLPMGGLPAGQRNN